MQKRKDHSGYKGTPNLWREALTCWQEEVSVEVKTEKFNFLNYDGSKEVEVLAKKFPDLPKSYLDFIEAGGPYLRSIESGIVNGVNIGFPSFMRFDEVNFYRNFGEGYPEWKELAHAYLPDVKDKDYFIYSLDGLNFNASEFENLFIVGQEGSKQGKAIYLINPIHKSVDGEWEGWFWYPARTLGAVRYKSFAHLVAQKYIFDLNFLEKTKESSLYWIDEEWENFCLKNLIDRDWIVN